MFFMIAKSVPDHCILHCCMLIPEIAIEHNENKKNELK